MNVIFLMILSLVYAANPPLPKLSPALRLVQSTSSYFSGPGMEVHIRPLGAIHEQHVERAQAVSIESIKNLYAPTKTPYRGEITNLTKCEPKFQPSLGVIEIAGAKVETLVGGVNSRRAFGACSAGDIAYVGSVFVYYSPSLKWAYEFRVLRKVKTVTAETYRNDVRAVMELSQKLIQTQR